MRTKNWLRLAAVVLVTSGLSYFAYSGGRGAKVTQDNQTALITASASAQQQKSKNPEAQGRILLARFEITKDAFNIHPLPRRVLFLYLREGDALETVRINGKDKQEWSFGTSSGLRLMRRLEKLDLPKMDYQKYFDALAKRPPKPGKEYWRTVDGSEVEVEIHIKDKTIRFKMWNPDTFFYNHQDDKIASATNAAVEAIIVTLGKRTVYF